MNNEKLKALTVESLRNLASSFEIKGISQLRKQELIDEILKETKKNDLDNSSRNQSIENSEENEEVQEMEDAENHRIEVSGILDLHEDGYGFMRSEGYNSGEEDTYVPPQQVRRFRLKTGDFIEGIGRKAGDTDKFSPLIYLHSVNGEKVDDLWKRPDFEDLTPIYPKERLKLESEPQCLSTRMIDLVAPIGKGQRGLIVSPPKAGKTTLIKEIANGIYKNNKDVHMMILLIDERPEEVTDMKRSVPAEVISSTFDELPHNHERISEIVIERAKRLVEHKKDVVILTDSITRLTRAYNMTTPPSGRTLSGGLDPFALHYPKKFFGAARNIEEGGSLTIIATALVATGSRMDDMIFEEFKGTGNMEVHLDRNLGQVRLFPAIDIIQSGTRKDELLQSQEEREAIQKIRDALANTDKDINQYRDILTIMKNTKSNEEFIETINKLDLK